MTAATTKDRLPRGVGRVPQWWMDITPHNTLNLDDDEARRHADYEQAMLYAQKAAEMDLMQKYGGEGFPDWDPAEMGPRTPEEEKEWVKTGYKRNESGKWVDESGEPLSRRQFEGKMPPGYVPGYYDPDKFGAGGKFGGASGLKSTTHYERDKGTGWARPDWMNVKLKKTGKLNSDKSPKPNAPKAVVAASAAPSIPDVSKEEEETTTEELKEENLGKLVKTVHRANKRTDSSDDDDDNVTEEEVVEDEEEADEDEIVEG